jgi:hypothetical protein
MQHDTEQLPPWFIGEQPVRPGWYDVTLREGWNTVRLLWNNGSWWAHDHAGETLHRIDSRIYDTLQWRGIAQPTPGISPTEDTQASEVASLKSRLACAQDEKRLSVAMAVGVERMKWKDAAKADRAPLEHMKRMETALKVLQTWAAFPPLDARQVRDLCANALRPDNARVQPP